mgnify:CR=1 FL=1
MEKLLDAVRKDRVQEAVAVFALALKVDRRRLQDVCRKRGFTNFTRKEYAIVNVESLNRFENGTEVTPELLIETKLVRKELDGIKILGQGELEKTLTVKAHKFSKSAVAVIEQAAEKQR